mgnify:FL=1
MSNKIYPIGIQNFEKIRKDEYFYIDKTAWVYQLAKTGSYYFLSRPRRFGKSLTVNMLQHYYDILAKDKFEALFGDLYIGKHPTRDRNSYLVLYLNFSGIVGELHNYRKGLDAHCQTMFDYFCDIYADYLPKGIKEELDKKEGAVEQFEYLFTECNKTNQRSHDTSFLHLWILHQTYQEHIAEYIRYWWLGYLIHLRDQQRQHSGKMPSVHLEVYRYNLYIQMVYH